RDTRVALRVDEVLRTDEPGQLPEVELGNEHLVVSGEHITKVGGERVQMPQVRVRDLQPTTSDATNGRGRCAPRTTPTEHEERRAVLVVQLDAWDVACDTGDLGRTQTRHLVVVLGVVADVARPVLLLDAADAVHQPRRPR